MNDFIYVPVEKGEVEGIGFDTQKAFDKGWTPSPDGWLKKVPVSEYPMYNLRTKMQKNLADYIKMRDGWKERTPQWHSYDLMVREYTKLIKELPEPSISPIQEDWKEKMVNDFKNWCEDNLEGYSAFHKEGARLSMVWAKQYIEENIINKKL